MDPSLYKSLLDLKRYVHAKRTIECNISLTPTDRASRLSTISVRGARVEDLCLDFTLPGYPEYELIENGKNVVVTLDNLEQYIDLVVEMTVGEGIRKQVEGFREGFDRVFPVRDLRCFSVQEMGVLVGGGVEDWGVDGEFDVMVLL